MFALWVLIASALAAEASPVTVSIKVTAVDGAILVTPGCRLLTPVKLGPLKNSASPVLEFEADCRPDPIFKSGME